MRVVVVPSLNDRDAYPAADPNAASGTQLLSHILSLFSLGC